MTNSFWMMHNLAEFYIDSLRNNICIVKFNKTNNEERTMRCTLMEKYLPNDNRADNNTPLHFRKGLAIVVWDLDNKNWRSFLPNSVIEFNAEKCLAKSL